MQRHVRVGNVMAKVSRCFEYIGSIVRFEGLNQFVIVVLYGPWNGAVFVERIGGEFMHRVFPMLWYFAERLFAIMVGIKEMARCFGGVDIAAFVGAYGVLGDEFDIGFVECAH